MAIRTAAAAGGSIRLTDCLSAGVLAKTLALTGQVERRGSLLPALTGC